MKVSPDTHETTAGRFLIPKINEFWYVSESLRSFKTFPASLNVRGGGHQGP